MKASYIRVSTLEQNIDRQTSDGKNEYIDKISGSVPFAERKQAMKLLKDIESGLINEVQVHSIDRLGRNTLDIMQTIQYLTNKGVNVISKKEGLQTLIEGKENPIAKLMIGILGTLAEFELSRIKERQAEGIAKAKVRGSYNSNGGKPEETKEEFLNKSKNKKCYNLIKQGNSLRNSAKLSEVSLGTAQKISKLIY
ncbi:MAG: recombinase family protein [Lutibacter sp.]|jgi:DNA invertase Pin-like site-specific DNA recombinase|nr:recombinase family protein [Lutibacter sp.]